MHKKELEKWELLLENAKTEKELMKLSESIGELISKASPNNALLHIRARIHIKLNMQARAINDYKTILEKNPGDKIATLQIEQLKTILKYNNLDIYANPNTNFDPWLD